VRGGRGGKVQLVKMGSTYLSLLNASVTCYARATGNFATIKFHQGDHVFLNGYQYCQNEDLALGDIGMKVALYEIDTAEETVDMSMIGRLYPHNSTESLRKKEIDDQKVNSVLNHELRESRMGLATLISENENIKNIGERSDMVFGVSTSVIGAIVIVLVVLIILRMFRNAVPISV
jgi:hypothetical protein